MPFSGHGVAKAPRIFAQRITVETTAPRTYALGTRGITSALVQHTATTNTPPVLPAADSFGDVRASVTDRWLRPQNPDHCCRGSQLLLREYALPSPDPAAATHYGAVLFRVPAAWDHASDLALCAPLEVVSSSHGTTPTLLGNFVWTVNGLDFTTWNPLIDAYERQGVSAQSKRFSGTPAYADAVLIESAATFLDAFRRAFYLAVSVWHQYVDYQAMVPMVEKAEIAAMQDVLTPLAARIARIAEQPNAYLNDYPFQRDLLKPLARRTRIKAHATQRIDIHDSAAKAMQTALTGHSTEIAFYKAFGNAPTPAARADLYRTHCEAVGAIYRTHFFPHIATLNALAVDAGFSDYAALVTHERFDFSPQDFYRSVRNYCASTQPTYDEFLRELQRLSDGAPVAIADVPALLSQLTIGAHPTIDRTSALQIATEIFRDMGVDLNAAPWNQIIIDIDARAKKMGRPGVAIEVESQPPMAMAFANLPEKTTLSQLTIFLYELGHAVQSQAAGDDAHGYMLLMSHDDIGGLNKTVNALMEKIVATPVLMKKYLRAHPEFTDTYLESFAHQSQFDAIWRTRRFMVYALMEMQLYRRRSWRDDTPLDDDAVLQQWHELVHEFLQVQSINAPFGDWVTRTLIPDPNFYLYLPSYTLGADLSDRIAHCVMPHGTAGLAAFGKIFLPLFARGARARLGDVQGAVQRLEERLA